MDSAGRLAALFFVVCCIGMAGACSKSGESLWKSSCRKVFELSAKENGKQPDDPAREDFISGCVKTISEIAQEKDPALADRFAKCLSDAQSVKQAEACEITILRPEMK